MVLVLEFFLHAVQSVACSWWNKSVHRHHKFFRTSRLNFFRHDANNNGLDVSDVQVAGNNIISRARVRGRGRRREFFPCRFNRAVVIGSK